MAVEKLYIESYIIIDSYSKWSECFSLRSTKAEYVARAFLNGWVSRQGLCNQLHTDRGGNVDTAEILKALYKMLGITKTANIAYRPQTDGCAERMVSTLKSMLWKYCQENPCNWVNCLDQVLFAYRTSIHSSTGFSPFFLDKGRLPHLPLHVMMGTELKNVLGETYSQAAYDLYHRLQEAYASANDSIRSKQISSKKRYDSKINVQTFIEGEWAYVWKPAPKECNYRKFYDHFRGPYKIVKKLTDHMYKIEIGENKYDVVHMELMKSAVPATVTEGDTIGYDCGEDDSLVEGQFPNDPQPAAEPGVHDNDQRGLDVNIGNDSQDRPIVAIPIRRYPDRIRRQTVPYQHTP